MLDKFNIINNLCVFRGGLTLSDESELQRKNLLKMINYLEIPE